MLRNEDYLIQVVEKEIVKQRVTELCSNQGEAYSKMFLAAKFVDSCGCNNFSGCDSTSWFHGIPKGLLGKTLQIEDDLFDMIKSIVCQAYGFLNKSNVNDVPYEKCCGKKFPEPSEILSTKDGLDQHVKCINYQEFVWKNAFEANQKIPEADQHSWSGIDGTYEVQ